MSHSLIRQIVSTISWSTFSFGIVFNCLLAKLILHRTPKRMQIYSRVLIQTCTTDMLLLIAVFIAEPIHFSTAKGGNGRWLNGILQIQNPDYRVFGFIAYIVYVFLVYVSLFNYVVQYIYRYLVLNSGFLFSFASYYIIFACTLAYLLICVLGWRMYKFVKNRGNLGGTGIQSYWQKQQEKMNEMNQQINRNLLIQAFFPLTIYIPLLFVVFGQLFGNKNGKLFPWIQYYYMLSIDPMWIPPALNPIVTILTIRPYRKVFIKSIHMLTKLLCCQFPTASSFGEGSNIQQQQQQQHYNNNNNKIISHHQSTMITRILP